MTMHTPDTQTHEAATTHLEDKILEKLFIVGSLALDSSIHLAAEAKSLLNVSQSVLECSELTRDFRTMFFGEGTSNSLSND
jgi:hypothetical protein